MAMPAPTRDETWKTGTPASRRQLPRPVRLLLRFAERARRARRSGRRLGEAVAAARAPKLLPTRRGSPRRAAAGGRRAPAPPRARAVRAAHGAPVPIAPAPEPDEAA